MKSKIDSVLNEAIESLFKDQKMDLPAGLSCDLQPPRESSHGDLSTNVAFKLSKLLRKKPADIAEAIVAFIEELGENSPVEHAKIAGGGFINFSLRKADLGAVLVAIYHADTRYGASEYGKGKKVIVEFVSANPTGPLTIAHGRRCGRRFALPHPQGHRPRGPSRILPERCRPSDGPARKKRLDPL